ncbi:hypothetical protein ACWU37_20650 [Photobacterium damselae subsp. damselae]
MNYKIKLTLVSILLSFSTNSVSKNEKSDPESNQTPMIAVDSLVKFADKKNHSAYISIVNTSKFDAYLMTNMNEVKIINNKLVKKALTINNMGEWKLFVSPPKMILRGNEEKKLKIKYDCSSNNCNISHDIIYQIPITPVPYNDEDGASSVAMAFGFAPYFIIPATEQNVDYDYKISNGYLEINNTGNTYINAVISTCEKVQKNDCIYEYKVLSGRAMKFKLPKEMIAKQRALMTVVNYDQTYRKTDKINFN